MTPSQIPNSQPSPLRPPNPSHPVPQPLYSVTLSFPLQIPDPSPPGKPTISFLGSAPPLRLAGVGLKRPAQHQVQPGATPANPLHDLGVGETLS